LVDDLARDAPFVVTRDDIAHRLRDLDDDRDADATVSELRRLGWLVGLPVQGTWSFIPPGQDATADPYLPLRAWQARDPNAAFMLAGANAAWHLGYLDRSPQGRVAVWLAPGLRLLDGLRRYLSVVRIPWPDDARGVANASRALLLRRGLDLVTWASGLPAFGPEALIVQLASRPASFAPWSDLVTHLPDLINDCDDDRLLRLAAGQSTATWQRAAYLLHAGGHPNRGRRFFDRRPTRALPKTYFEYARRRTGDRDTPTEWIAEYYIVDRLIAPLQRDMSKA
jgi:hypothetical protein